MSDVFVFAFQLGLDFYKCTFTTPRLGDYAAGGKKEAHSNQAFYGDTFNAGNDNGEYILKSVLRRFDYLLH